MIVIVDYGMGNVRSLRNAFEFLGHDAIISRDVDKLESADRIVLPGVGAFRDAVDAIRNLGLEDSLQHCVLEDRKPLLGVCLGMQLIANTSAEYGMHKGLGWIDADVVPLKHSSVDKVPHVGWNNGFPNLVARKVLTVVFSHEGLKNRMGVFFFFVAAHRRQDLFCTIELVIRRWCQIRPVRLDVAKVQTPAIVGL